MDAGPNDPDFDDCEADLDVVKREWFYKSDDAEDPFFEFFPAHDFPERPLDAKSLICSCVTCRLVLERTAATRPQFTLGLKTPADRIVVSAEYLMEVMDVDPTLDPLLYVEGDYVREIFVPVEGPYLWRQRWWSLSYSRDREAVGKRHPKSQKARRQSKAAREANSARIQAREEALAAERRAKGIVDEPVVFVEVSDAVAPVRRTHRSLITEAAEWALARGVAIDRDLLALIIAGTGGATRFEREYVGSAITCHIFNWCSARWVLIPDGIQETFWQWLTFLADTGRLDPQSDPLIELLKPFVCAGGLDWDGKPAGPDFVRPDCECNVRYRGPSHGEVAGPVR